MSTESTRQPHGRAAQRRRTRKAIVAATIDLLREGETPTIDQIAEAADVSRRTIYMHFPTLDQLLLDAAAGLLVEADIDASVQAGVQGDDVAARVTALAEAVTDPATLPLGRKIIALTVTADPGEGDIKRGYRRIAWIEQAVEPLRPKLTDEQYQRLVSALAVVLGWEAMIVLRDIRGLDDDGERAVITWTARALVEAMLTEAAPVQSAGRTGLSPKPRADHGIPVRMLDAEAPHARGQVIEQATELQIMRAAWRPQVLLWSMRILRAGAARVERLTEVAPFTAGSGPLDLPGRPVPVPTPGHTTGHCAFHLPQRGVLIAGDALMTAHPMGRTTGPQLLPRMFNHDEVAALASLRALAGLAADVVLPGHGPAYHGSPASAVQQALAAHR